MSSLGITNRMNCPILIPTVSGTNNTIKMPTAFEMLVCEQNLLSLLKLLLAITSINVTHHYSNHLMQAGNISIVARSISNQNAVK